MRNIKITYKYRNVLSVWPEFNQKIVAAESRSFWNWPIYTACLSLSWHLSLLAKKYFNFIVIMIVVAICCHLHCISIKIVAKLFRCTQKISHALTQTSKLVEQMKTHIKDIYTIYLYKYI